MNEDNLRRIEDALGRPLPTAFRQVMLNFPQSLIDAARMTDPDSNEFMDEMMISLDAESLLALGERTVAWLADGHDPCW